MMKLNWKKSMAAVLAGIMSFGVLSTTLAVPAEASSRRTDPPRIEQDRDIHRPQPQISQRDRDRDQARWEREHRNDRDRRYKSSKSHSTGEVTTAAVLGAVVGAVIAKNT
ncbi:hypothetical protein [Mitsuokella multacida]|jgi:hypothetical protein|uniref:hypothetical protein n=1 Tax=Mitsuokella multacida TaxID=52226 RepID=UPI001F1DF640|nr:hypothetical protein [Mitsuokella multacida]MCF2584325.1 hypothetical protein [Mitsuokella multacida]